MKLLVTGGAGFIGSNFIRYYLEAEPSAWIVNLDKLTYAGNLENLLEIASSPRYRFVRGDICDTHLLDGILSEKIDAIVHFAAESHVDRSIADARAFIHTNVQGAYTLLETARRHRVPRFVHISTDEVYGSLEPNQFADESALLRPSSPYAASKASSDLLVGSFWRTFQFPAIITRCSNNYGPFQFPEKLVPLMVTNALEGKRLPVYGDGLNERDWIFVEDHCSAITQVLRSGQPGEVYNIGFGRPVTNLEIIRLLLGILHQSENQIEFVADRPGHDRRYALDTAKAARDLGWKPRVGLEEGLVRTVKWYCAHPDWINKAKSGEYRTFYERFYQNRSQSLAEL